MHQKKIENNTTDERLKKLSVDIIHGSPYLLSVPTDYRVNPSHADDWRRGSPFGADEEKLQYVSFMPRVYHDTLLTADDHWDDGNGAMADKASQSVSTRRSSGTTSPGQTPRKKISLEEYKLKKAAEASAKTSPRGGAVPKLPEKAVRVAASAEKEGKPATEDRSHGQKR